MFDKSHFPFFQKNTTEEGCVFLDNAATTHKPYAVINAMSDFYAKEYAPVYRGIYKGAEQATCAFEKARSAVANFIGADSDEIIFTKGTTESLNAVAFMWADSHIHAGDEIAITALEHHANLLPWQRIATKKGARLVVLPIAADGLLDVERSQRLITERTKLIAATMVSNAIGTSVDIKQLAHCAQAVGACLVVDAAQAVGHQIIDVKALGCDFLAFSGHKMLGPTGIGILYAKKNRQNQLEPYQLGGGMVRSVSYQTASWLPFPRCFEAGTPPLVEAIGLSAAIEYLEKIDRVQLQKHTAHLSGTFIDALQQMKGVTILGPVEQLKTAGHIVSFAVDGMHPHDCAAYLDQKGICVRAGALCAQPLLNQLGYEGAVRASFYGYNEVEDVEKIVHALRGCV